MKRMLVRLLKRLIGFRRPKKMNEAELRDAFGYEDHACLRGVRAVIDQRREDLIAVLPNRLTDRDTNRTIGAIEECDAILVSIEAQQFEALAEQKRLEEEAKKRKK